MNKPDQIESGLFVRLSTKTISDLYRVLETEGYDPDPEGVGAFLSDVAAGKLSEQTSEPHPHGDILEALGRVAKAHGPDLARAALDAFKRGRA